ncbi:MAG TPA: branched-chain amino acid ABC transporter substrate-binding protein [Candidatus Limnocylindrales bacterium]
MRVLRLGAVITTAALVFTACSSSPSASGGGGGNVQEVKIGVDLPLSGGETPNGGPTLNGVKLAVSKISVPGYHVTVEAEDDAVNGVHDPNQGAKNIQTLVNDSAVFAVVGPFNSSVAKAEIPVSNSAGLIQCSPANTNPSLTKPDQGAKDLRKTNPDKIAYVRVATTDDIQGAAGADIAYNVAGAKSSYVVDDTETYGKGLADVFVDQFQKLGGTLVGRDGAGKNVTDYTSLLTAAKAKNPGFVYFGGVTATGGGLLRKQMISNGMGSIPFGGGDGINDGSAATASSFLNLAGPDGDMNSYSTVAAIHDIPNPDQFKADYKAMFNVDPGAYSASAYACTQIFLEALGKVGPDREKVRAYVTDTTHKYNTALGTLSFDANGDTSQHIISYYKFDPSTKDWAFFKQKDFGSSGS